MTEVSGLTLNFRPLAERLAGRAREQIVELATAYWQVDPDRGWRSGLAEVDADYRSALADSRSDLEREGTPFPATGPAMHLEIVLRHLVYVTTDARCATCDQAPELFDRLDVELFLASRVCPDCLPLLVGQRHHDRKQTRVRIAASEARSMP